MPVNVMGRPRGWSYWPLRWSRGLRRRTVRIWRTHFDAAVDIESAAERFAALCASHGAPDPGAAATWRRTLLALGFRAEARALTISRRRDRVSERQLEALHRRISVCLGRVALLFQRNRQSLPTTISPRDARLTAVLDWAATLRPAACIADLGCGSGRFLEALSRALPAARLVGLDLAPSLLLWRPAAIGAAVGSLLNLPMRDGALDAVFSVEALEHALRPRAAVAEMLRVLRPGGRLLIIDKHRALQGRSEHEAWERWFTLEEVAEWLAPHARVERRELLPPDGADVPPGLFCCWTAVKHD